VSELLSDLYGATRLFRPFVTGESLVISMAVEKASVS